MTGQAARRSLGRGQEAVSPLIGFMVATVLFSVSFYYVVDTAVRREGDPTSAVNANYADLAQTLARAVMAPGEGWYTGGACSAGGEILAVNFSPEEVGRLDAQQSPLGRFGLGDENCGRSSTDPRSLNNLSFSKFSNLYTAKFSADGANQRVDYEEALRSLGLDEENIDFHLRTWPVLASTRQLLKTGAKDPYMKPLYIGTYVPSGGGGGPRLVPHVVGLEKLGDRVIAHVNITNDGTVPTVFDVTFEVRLKKGTPDATMHTPLLAVDGVGRTNVTFLKTSDWEWKKPSEAWIKYTISDRAGEVGSGTISMDGVTMTYATPARKLHFLEAGALFYDVSGGAQSVTAYFNAFNGKGERVTATDWTYRLYRPDGTIAETYVIPNGETGSRVVSLSAAGNYRMELRNDALSVVWNNDTIRLNDGDIDQYVPGAAPGSYAPSAATLEETRYIDLLVELFDRQVYTADYSSPPEIPYSAAGDVYPADKHLIKDYIPDALAPGGTASLATYTTLIVGSDVDQTVMNSGMVKWTIEDWVEAGGTLLVLGSDGSKNNWLNPVYGATLEAAGSGLGTPDQDHPVLNVPNRLDYAAYIKTSEWQVDHDGFTHVVTTATGDLLTVAEPGAIGDGRVVLTGWRPSALTNDQATTCPDTLDENTACQGLFLFHNFLSMTYRHLYLDYGPPIPQDSPTGVHVRVGSVYHPELNALVAITLQVIVFGG